MAALYLINTEVPTLRDSLSWDTNQCVCDITTKFDNFWSHFTQSTSFCTYHFSNSTHVSVYWKIKNDVSAVWLCGLSRRQSNICDLAGRGCDPATRQRAMLLWKISERICLYSFDAAITDEHTQPAEMKMKLSATAMKNGHHWHWSKPVLSPEIVQPAVSSSVLCTVPRIKGLDSHSFSCGRSLGHTCTH